MNVKRTAMFGAGCGALAVWLSAAATSGTRPAAPLTVRPPSAIDTSGAALSAEIARLHERLRPTTSPIKARDLFHYAGRSAPAAAPIPVNAPPAALPVPAAVPTPSPRLVGLAEDPGPDGPVRTAIISASGELFFVKEGETFALRYRVDTISPGEVQLSDLGDHATLHLPMK
jgi:hypothetical protein